jgi:hypothetical protein
MFSNVSKIVGMSCGCIIGYKKVNHKGLFKLYPRLVGYSYQKSTSIVLEDMVIDN